MRRWATLSAVMFLMASLLAVPVPVAAQYADPLLPQGVLQVTVEEQPINATTSPVVAVTNPRFAGSLTTGGITIELAVADAEGNVIRFPTEVNRRGVFRQRPPEELQAGSTYTLYISDAMIGQFSIAPDAGGGGGGGGGSDLLELARVVPFPQDAGGAIPGLGLVPELSYYQSIGELARIIAQNANNDTREGRDQAQAELEASGFIQRYQSSMAVPSADDPGVFEVQIASIVTEYDTAETAAASFTASATGGETVETATVGDESRVSRQSATATQTGAEYQSLQLIFRQGRLLTVINYADLLNREPDLAVMEAIGQAVQQRAATVLSGEAPALTQRSLPMSLGGVPRTSVEQYYEAIDGALVPLFGESEENQTARATFYTGASDVSTSNFISRGTGENQTPEAGEQVSAPFSYTTALLNFPSADDAAAWLGGLSQQSPGALLPEYLSLSPVTDAPTFGEASATFTFTRQLEGTTASGFLTYAQVGETIAAVELAAVPESSFAALEPLVTAQVECLTANACPAVDAPAGIAATGGGGDGQGDGGQGDGGGEEQAAPEAETDAESDLPTGIQREGGSEDEESE